MTGITEPADHHKPVVVGAGLVALDVVMPRAADLVVKLWAGGTCGNVLTALHYLGWQAYPVARLKPDSASIPLRADLHKWGVALDFVELDEEGSTPVIIERVGLDTDGEPYHTFSKRCPSCGATLPGYKPILAATAQALIPKLGHPQVFFFDRVSRGTLLLAKACAERGALVCFEPSGVGTPEHFAEALELAHVVKYSSERMGDVEELRAGATPLLMIETLGRAGLRYRSRFPHAKTNGWDHLPAYPVRDVRDTAGAGDWCSAGLLYRLAAGGAESALKVTGEQMKAALRFGQALASWTCRFEGARGGMYAMERDQVISEVMAVMELRESTSVEQTHPGATNCPFAGGFCPACANV